MPTAETGATTVVKAWWTEVDEEDLAKEVRFLEGELYLREVQVRPETITAYERYKVS